MRRTARPTIAVVLGLICGLLAALTATAATGGVWHQVGDDIDGQAEKQRAGDALSMSTDGLRVAVGSKSQTGEAAPRVQVFDWSGSAWVQLGADLVNPAPGGAWDAWGESVSLSGDGNRLAVGASARADNGPFSGQVRVFDWNGSAWVQAGSDILGAPGSLTGVVVALSRNGSRLGVSARAAGEVRVYSWSGSAWVQSGNTIDGLSTAVEGASIALDSDGSHLAVGAPGTNNFAGQVQVYNLFLSAWVPIGTTLEGATGDEFGTSVSLSDDGNQLGVGAPADDGAGSGAGTVRVFTFTQFGWVQVGDDIDGETPEERLGASVALSSDGKRVVVGAPGRRGSDPVSVVRVFESTGSLGQWTQVGDTLSTGLTEDDFGRAVAMNGDGTRFAAGAQFTGTSQGRVYVFVEGDPLTCAGLQVTIDLSSPGATGVGTPGDDVILGTSGADNISALGGNDTVCAGDGDDTVSGGDGDDLIIAGAGNDTVMGDAGRDVIRGNEGVDQIDGGIGNDRLLGGIDGDTLNGGDGNDFIGGFGGDDTINGGPGNETIFGGFGADTIDAGPGDDSVFGLIGDDIIEGGTGNDVLNGDRGRDTINGGPGNDTIRGGNAPDMLFGDDGNDNVAGGKADDTLTGGNGTDTCVGNLGTDTAVTCETTFGIP